MPRLACLLYTIGGFVLHTRSRSSYGNGVVAEQDHGYYGFLNTIPTQSPRERRPSKPKPAARTASAASSARATTEPLATSTPPHRTAAARLEANSASTLGKIFAATAS